MPPFKFSEGDEYIIFAAMIAMVEDMHCVQDNLTDEQWTRASELLRELTFIVDQKVKDLL